VRDEEAGAIALSLGVAFIVLVLVVLIPDGQPDRGLPRTEVSTMGWENLTLPMWGGFQLTYPGNGHVLMNGPVLSKHGPGGVLTAYYVDAAGNLVAENVGTRQTTLLHSWEALNTLGATDGVLNGVLNGYEAANGSLTMLYSYGTTQAGAYGYLYTQVYYPGNGTYSLTNSTWYATLGGAVPIESMGPYGDGGWWFWSDMTSIVFWSEWDPLQHYSMSFPAAGPGDWNTAEYIPATSTIVEDLNTLGGSVQVFAWQFDTTDRTVSMRVFYSPHESFIESYDQNNQPYFYRSMQNGSVLLWGIGSNGVNMPSYHVLTVRLFPDMARDYVVSVNDTYASGATEIANNPIPDQSGYWVNGYDGFSPSPSEWQAPFEDPVRGIALYSQSPWLNEFFHSHGWGWLGSTSSVTSSLEYLGTTGCENAVPNGNDGILLYWMAGCA
jgi:hypothetical protein